MKSTYSNIKGEKEEGTFSPRDRAKDFHKRSINKEKNMNI